MKTSAYLSVFDDWHLLGPAMASIAPRVDELVVVDGAYRWMAPFLAASGRDPAHSLPPVRDALAPYAHKTRWISQIWDNELEKRAAGYAACSHRWIWRVDADELHFIDEGALDRFFAGGYAVGEMAIPIYVTPGLVRGRVGGPPERTSLIFDAQQVDARAHLSTLWLIVPASERAQIAAFTGRCAPEAVAFTAHLTGWRPPTTAINRARFYVLNYLREHPGPRHKVFRYDAAAGFAPMLEQLTPDGLAEVLAGHAIVTGLPDMSELALLPTPLSPVQDGSLAPLYATYLASLAALNARLSGRWRTIAAGDDQFVDLSTAAATAPFHRAGALHFRYAQTLNAARAIVVWLHRDPPYITLAQAPVTIDGGAVRIDLPPDPHPPLRRVLRLAAWTRDGAPLLQMRAGL